MRISIDFILQRLAATVALAMLAGCAGAGLQQLAQAPGAGPQGVQGRFMNGRGLQRSMTPIRPTTKRSFMTPSAVREPLIFLSDGYATVDIYLQTGKHKLVGWVTGLTSPTDLATDSARNLYISLNGGFSGGSEVLVYAPPYTKAPKLTLQPNQYPFGIAVSQQGVLAVTGCTNASCGDIGVTFYAKGSSTPCATVATYPAMYPGYDAFDDEGNLFVDGSDPSNNQVVGEITGGCNAASLVPLTIGNVIGFAGGMQISRKGRIAILDTSSNAVIDTYLPPKNDSLGNPVSTTPLTNSSSAAAFTFLATGRTVWVADASGGASNYDYPVGGVAEQTIMGGGFPYGIAVTPALLP